MLLICLFALALGGEAAKLEEKSFPDFPYYSTCPEEYDLQTYAHPDSCHSFYKCANGTLTEELCEHGLLFDGRGATHNHCNYYNKVDCQGRYAEVIPHASGPCEYDYSQQLAGPCEKYYIKCQAAVPEDTPCIEGLAYDNRTQTCNWPDLMIEEFGCDPEQVVGFRCPTEIDPKSLTARFIPFPRFASDDCHSFIVCVNDYPRRTFCGEYNVFSEETLSCQDPTNVVGKCSK